MEDDEALGRLLDEFGFSEGARSPSHLDLLPTLDDSEELGDDGVLSE